METLEEEMILAPGACGNDSTIFHHTSQNCAQFEIQKLLISGVSHLILSDHGRSQVTEILETESTDKKSYNCLSLVVLVRLGYQKNFVHGSYSVKPLILFFEVDIIDVVSLEMLLL